jgi:hypothetical protein
MNRRAAADTVAQSISSAAATAGVTPEILASATDTDVSETRALLDGDRPATLTDLVRVGGFLRIPVGHFLEGAVA